MRIKITDSNLTCLAIKIRKCMMNSVSVTDMYKVSSTSNQCSPLPPDSPDCYPQSSSEWSRGVAVITAGSSQNCQVGKNHTGPTQKKLHTYNICIKLYIILIYNIRRPNEPQWTSVPDALYIKQHYYKSTYVLIAVFLKFNGCVCLSKTERSKKPVCTAGL